MSPSPFEIRLSDHHATESLGGSLARTFPGAFERSAVVYLHGDLGAGKTTCVRGLLRALGVTGPVRSPTYTLIEPYALGPLTCIHIDLFRLRAPVEVDDLGLRDYMGGGCLLLIEWPEKGGAGIPGADLNLYLTYEGDERLARACAATELGRTWLSKLGGDTSLNRYVSNLT